MLRGRVGAVVALGGCACRSTTPRRCVGATHRVAGRVHVAPIRTTDRRRCGRDEGMRRRRRGRDVDRRRGGRRKRRGRCGARRRAGDQRMSTWHRRSRRCVVGRGRVVATGRSTGRANADEQDEGSDNRPCPYGQRSPARLSVGRGCHRHWCYLTGGVRRLLLDRRLCCSAKRVGAGCASRRDVLSPRGPIPIAVLVFAERVRVPTCRCPCHLSPRSRRGADGSGPTSRPSAPWPRRRSLDLRRHVGAWRLPRPLTEAA